MKNSVYVEYGSVMKKDFIAEERFYSYFLQHNLYYVVFLYDEIHIFNVSVMFFTILHDVNTCCFNTCMS